MGKRANGEGSIYQRKDGRWVGQYTIQTENGQKRRTIYGKDRETVAKKLTQAVADRDRGLVFDAGSLTVGDYLDRWLNDSVKGSVKRRTYEGYASIVARHLKPAVGSVKLAKLTPPHVQRLYRAKLDGGLSPTTVQHLHTTLYKALKQAVRWKLIQRNVCEAVTVPRRDSPEMRPLTPEEARRFVYAASGDRLEALWILAISTGMRQGELLGLRWRDVDFQRRVVRINQTLVTGSGSQTFEKPKTKSSRRSISLTRRALQALQAHRGKAGDGDGLVFTSASGGPLDPANLRRRGFNQLLKRADLPPIRFHDLRHTAATLLLAANVHPKIVQNMLGHANISVTLDTYSHVLADMQGPATDAMDDALS